MNKKTLLIKIAEFIHKTNISYKKSNIVDMAMILLFIFMLAFGKITALVIMLLTFILRAIYEFDILERLGVIDEEETSKINKFNDKENIKNTK